MSCTWSSPTSGVPSGAISLSMSSCSTIISEGRAAR